jgi:16S rRNA (uracil1498-N3)-methyltransferase
MHYFIGKIDLEEKLVYLDKEESHHCAVVLRLKEGEKIGVLQTSNEYAIYIAELLSISKNECVGKIIEKKIFLSPKINTHLIISPPKNNERLEWLVEKCVELQAHSLIFIKSERCIRKSINLDRLSKLSISAAKQSANPILVQLEFFQSFSNLIHHLSEYSNKHHLLAHCEKSENKISITPDYLIQLQNKKIKDVFIWIGPEGDWTHEEIQIIKGIPTMDLFDKKEITVDEINLGSTRLRTETAAIYVLSLMKSISN